ncbi:putative glycoside hydrolase [Paenibacillus xanthanilyticus]|uniref:Glycoside hydrolase n=1 Tax=Paenibacillus xanthanilyticus TaxID=1783531 RepID=A0ABV8JXN3_9BACL
MQRSLRTVIIMLAVFILVISSGCTLPAKRNESVLPKVAAEGTERITGNLKKEPLLKKRPNMSRPSIRTKTWPQAAPTIARVANTQPVRGIYVSGWVAGDPGRMAKLIRLIEKTDLNAMVIDVKNDYGNLTYKSNVPEVKAIKADASPPISNIRSLLKQLHAKQIYTIGRVVAFKDPYYARMRPSQALQRKAGGVWRDAKGVAWLDPYQARAREYNIAIAKEAANLGFDEVQFDYVRFPDNGVKVNQQVRFAPTGGRSKAAIIGTFLREARHGITPTGAKLSVDVFGLVTSSTDDMGIGQTWREIAGTVDVISPMTYPSHYSSGMYGIKSPDLHPSAVIKQAMKDAKQQNEQIKQIGRKPARIRPWLQSFTATWVDPHQNYGVNQVRAQVLAARKQGIHEFLLWSSNCKYDYRS